MILILDFGSQYTQLIAKVLRASGYESKVISGTSPASDIVNFNPKGIILSGSPLSATEIEKNVDPDILNIDLPKLAICFGYQWAARVFGGKVERQTHREYGAAYVERTDNTSYDPLLKGMSHKSRVWMSHGDSVVELPQGSQLLLESKGKISAYVLKSKKLWALQFHPEVHHSDEGKIILENFAREICREEPNWSLKCALEETKEKLAEKLKGVKKVYCAVSGGVDSTVLAVLLSEFVEVAALFVDHGFCRNYDYKDLKNVFSHYPHIHLHCIDAQEKFWSELEGVSDPEEKRKIIGKLFIETFYEHLPHEERFYLGQGTIYSDVIESAANEFANAQKIKSHHNVGGLPPDLKCELVEPLRNFFKDEVRAIGKILGLKSEFLDRHPFPGPGLAIRLIGELRKEKIEILQKCDEIFHDELNARTLYDKTWQAFVVLLPVSSVGVMGDERSFENVACIRAVSSLDAMTAEATELPWKDLKEIAARIVNEVKGVNRVVYDLSSKPPATIEWE